MTTSPLVEPGGRISRIRLSPKSPHQQHSQRKESHSGKVLVVALVGRGFPAALTSPLEMLRQPAQHIGIDIAHGFARIAQTVVPGPAAQMAVEFDYQVR